MLKKIDSTSFMGHGPIKILYPGLTFSNSDSGIGSIGRIDHPIFYGNTIINMHPHVNDEILTYTRTGSAEHRDSQGIKETISSNKLMLMKAGRSFSHEEKIIGAPEPLEALQIFIRPGKVDLKPEVVFMDLDQISSENTWRLIASPGKDTAFQFSSQTWIYDMKLLPGEKSELPELDRPGLTSLLYVFNGEVLINDKIKLGKKDALVIKDERIEIKASGSAAELVLFVTDERTPAYSRGMYSGNKRTEL